MKNNQNLANQNQQPNPDQRQPRDSQDQVRDQRERNAQQDPKKSDDNKVPSSASTQQPLAGWSSQPKTGTNR